MILPTISIEQNNIIEQLALNNNVVVDSVAGSGKTTSNLHIASFFSNMNILLLTYNSKLKLETREKVQKLGIKNIEVHSYHSFCVKYYNNKCFTDTTIKKIIKNKSKPLKTFNYNLIVLDEGQDINYLYYELICKIYNDNININTQLCIFGDKKQSIFDFNGADERFIEYATEIFNFNPSYNWIKCNLPTSFRITYEMSLFINKCLLHNNRIISTKITNNKPRYIICDTFGNDIKSRTLQEIKYYLKKGYKPSDIFVLAPSIKSQSSPVRQLENRIKLTMPEVLVFVPSNENEIVDEEMLKDKIVFSTFHQTKGLERKVVIIFGFDASYFKYYKKDSNPKICPNELYVATTRGIEHLTVFHQYTNDYLPFVNQRKLHRYCYFEENRPLNIKEIITTNNNIITPVTDCISFLPQDIVDNCFNQLVIKENEKFTYNKIDIPLTTSNDESTESVSEITGIAIPSMFELLIKKKMAIFNALIIDNFENNLICQSNLAENIKQKTKQYNLNFIKISALTVDQLLYIANCWNSCKSGYLFKIYQITNYTWLSKDNLDECIKRITNLNIANNARFEYRVSIENTKELLNRELIGYLDCVDNNIIYEFKCVNKITKEHYLQLAVYMYMYEMNKKTDNTTSYVLFNILTNEYYTIECDIEKLKEIIKIIIYSKYIKKKVLTNKEFLENNRNIYNLYF